MITLYHNIHPYQMELLGVTIRYLSTFAHTQSFTFILSPNYPVFSHKSYINLCTFSKAHIDGLNPRGPQRPDILYEISKSPDFKNGFLDF